MMTNIPELEKCCGCIPFKVAQFLIAFLALLIGGTGITAVVFLALWEDNVALIFGKLPENLKWPIIGLTGFISMLLAICGFVVLIAPCLKTAHSTLLQFGFWILLFMCCVILFLIAGPTIACMLAWFNLLDSAICMKDFMSMEVMLILVVFVFVFVSAWCYFAMAIGNHSNSRSEKQSV